jgi:hypothetical protein
MDLQLAQEGPRLFGRERFVERSRDMRIEVVTDQDHLLRVGRFVVLGQKIEMILSAPKRKLVNLTGSPGFVGIFP